MVGQLRGTSGQLLGLLDHLVSILGMPVFAKDILIILESTVNGSLGGQR